MVHEACENAKRRGVLVVSAPMPNRLHVWSLASLVVALAGCGGRGCSGSGARNDRRHAAADAARSGAPAARGNAPTTPSTPVLTLTAVDASTAQVGSVREGVNLLGVELYGRLREAPGNLALSPAGVAASLAMVAGGARGETLTEMRRVLHHPADERGLHQVLGEEVNRWRYGDAGDAGDDGLLRFAHRLYVAEGNTFVDGFIDLTMHAYQTSFDRVDFRDANAARARMNAWTSGQTDGRVDEAVPADGVTNASRMVLAGGFYLRVAWLHRFSLAQTRQEPFQGERPGQAAMMHLAGTFGYAAPEGVKVVELPLRDGGLVMDVILPAEASGFAELESGLTPQRLQAWVDALTPTRVDVALPRFTIHPRAPTPLRPPLEALGMTRAFDAIAADFSGIGAPRNPAERLSLSGVFHRTIVEVTEYGGGGSAESPAPRPAAGATGAAFRADRAFLFVVRDPRTGLLVLLGRVVDPAA
jgi:serpin B